MSEFKSYKTLMAEAKQEYNELMASGYMIPLTQNMGAWYKPTVKERKLCACGKFIDNLGAKQCWTCRAIDRAKNCPPCFCGKPYFLKGLCISCYYKDYRFGKKRKTRKRVKCFHCDKYIFAKGVCSQLYFGARKMGVSVERYLELTLYKDAPLKRTDGQKS